MACFSGGANDPDVCDDTIHDRAESSKETRPKTAAAVADISRCGETSTSRLSASAGGTAGTARGARQRASPQFCPGAATVVGFSAKVAADCSDISLISLALCSGDP
mmetsp:Transcript_20229/g.47353  ORF Transcript_20229/g.47353 Transcript_20229/m.47353 type:complete len:106 (-) Transcript_20229:50-367(-)